MSDTPRKIRRTPGEAPSTRPADGRPVPRAMLVLAGLLAIEALGVAAATALLVVQLVVAHDTSTSLASGIALVVTAGAVVVGLVAVALGARRGAAWTRAAAIVWQLLQAVVGLNALTGVGAQPVLAAVLIVPAALGLILCFSPSVIQATRRI